MEITRSGILRDCLEEKNREMHRYSRHGAGLLPIEGYEKHFEDLQKTCEALRTMIREAEDRERCAQISDFVSSNADALMHPAIQERLAQWQKDLMAGKQPDMSWADRPDEPKPAQPEERQPKEYVWNPVTQTWDDPEYQPKHARPAPVTYPGGE